MIRPVKRQRPQRDITTLKLYQDERDRWLKVLDQFAGQGTQQEKMSVVLEWLEKSLPAGLSTQAEPDDLEQLAHLFITPLQPLKDPEAIRTLCRQEIADLEQDYYPEDYLPQYKRAIAQAIRSRQLPLMDGQTAERTSYIKEGVNYEQRTHYALIFLDNLEHDLSASSASPPQGAPTRVTPIKTPQNTPSKSVSPPQSAAASERPSPPSPVTPTTVTDQKLDTLTTVLTQLVQVIQREQGAPIEPETAHTEIVQQNGHSQPEQIDLPDPKTASATPEAEQPKKKGRRRGNTSAAAEAKITQAINAIMAYNNEPHRTFEEKWMITSSILKRLTKSYQGVIQRVLKARADDLYRHHQIHGMSGRHNVRHGRAGVTIDQVIALKTD